MSNYKGMHNPAHPGAVLRTMWLEPLGLSVTLSAEVLGISRKTLSRILNEHAPISPEMAMRIELAFDSRAGFWLDMQAAYDAWQIEQRRREIAKEVHHYSEYAAA